MNFEFGEEQNMLREQARGFLADNCSMKVVREALESGKPFNPELWQKVAEMGWTSTVIPEQYDGLGLSYLELSVIADELGRSVAPLPFSSSVYLATEAVLHYGSESQKQNWLPKLASGEVIGTFALAESMGATTPAKLQTTGTEQINGSKIAVPDGDVADFAIVVCKNTGGDGARLAIVDLKQDGVQAEAVSTIDPSRSHATLTFSGAAAEPLGDDENGWAAVQNLLNVQLYLWPGNKPVDPTQPLRWQKNTLWADTRLVDRYGYQAIKHKLANMYVKNTLARSNCYYGAWALNTDAPELPIAAASARVAGIQAYYFASKENIQTHGGMGFTWEFDCQFHYRRAKLLSVSLGSEGQWQDKLISAIEADAA